MAKYKITAEKLADGIRKGSFRDLRLPSESAICRKYSISRITARAALKTLEDSGLVTAIPGKGRMISGDGGAIDFNRKKAAKSIACICAAGRMLPAYGIIYNRMRELCAKNGISDSLFFIEGGSIESFAPQLAADRFSGIIILGVMGRKIIGELAALNLKTVYTAYDHPLVANSVSTDNYAGGWLAAEHLLANGHRNILVIDRGDNSDPSFAHRRDGFLKRISDEETECKTLFCKPVQRGKRELEEFRATLTKNGITAVFLTTDMNAPTLFNALRELKLKVPGNISVLGYDNMVNNEEVPDVKIDSFAQNWLAIAENAFELVTDIKERNLKINIKPELIVQGTVKKIGT